MLAPYGAGILNQRKLYGWGPNALMREEYLPRRKTDLFAQHRARDEQLSTLGECLPWSGKTDNRESWASAMDLPKPWCLMTTIKLLRIECPNKEFVKMWLHDQPKISQKIEEASWTMLEVYHRAGGWRLCRKEPYVFTLHQGKQTFGIEINFTFQFTIVCLMNVTTLQKYICYELMDFKSAPFPRRRSSCALLFYLY